MKSIITLFALFLCIISIQSQEIEKEQKSLKRNELSINLGSLAYNNLNIKYDYLLNESSSIGLRLSYKPDRVSLFGIKNYSENIDVTIDYKLFFSKHKAKGFYTVAFIGYDNSKYYLYNYTTNNIDYNQSRRNGTAYFGLGVGYKYVTKSNFFFDGSLRLSQKLFSTNGTAIHCKPQLLFSIGKRF